MMGLLWKQAPPFILLVLGGVYALKQINQFKFDIKGEKSRITKFEQLSGVKLKAKPLGEIHEELQKKVSKDWENHRIPRPYETDNNASILEQKEEGSASTEAPDEKRSNWWSKCLL